MKNYLSIWTLWLSLSMSYAQSTKLDSLNRQISQATTDTGRINLQNRKIGLLAAINIDSSIRLANETIGKARQISYKKGEAKAWIKLAFSYSLKGDFGRGRTSLGSAEQLLATRPDSSLRCDTYAGYGTLYGMQSKYDSAVFYFEQAIRIGQRIHHPSLSTFYQNAAISYQMQSNYPKTLAYQQLALALAERAGDADPQGYILMNMGLTYKTMGDTHRAEQFLFRAIKMARIAGTRNVQLYAYSNLATLYHQQRDFKKSYQFAIQAATLGAQLGDQGIQAASLAKAASSLGQQRNFAKADELARQALVIADSAHQPLVTYQVNAAMGELLSLVSNYRGAIPYLEKSFAVLQESDIYDEQIGETYHLLSACYEKTGNYRSALSAYRRSAEIADSIRSKENIRKATELTMNADFNRRQQVAAVQQQREKAVASIRQRSLLGGLILTLLVAVAAFIAFRTKQKANGLLQQQKKQIEDTLTTLRTAQDRLIHTEKMASLGELTAGIAHEIQNPLNFVNNFAGVSTELVDEFDEEYRKPNPDAAIEAELLTDIRENLQKIHHHGRRADTIVKGMLAHSRTGTGTRQLTNLNVLADEYLKLAYQGLRARDPDMNADLITEFDPGIGKVEVVPEEIGRVLLNLYNNAFYAVQQRQLAVNNVPAGMAEHDPERYQPTVSVRTQRQNGQVEISVEDNGTGIPDSLRAKIFQPFFTTKPTGEGTGLGLSLSYDIITKGHGGTISVDSKAGQYTLMRIGLPLTRPVLPA